MSAYVQIIPDTVHYTIKDKTGALRFHVMVDIQNETVEITKHGHSRDSLVFPLSCLDEISEIFSDTARIIKLKPEKEE